MTKILFLGDMAGTGFGTVTMDLGRALLDLGEDVRFVSLNEWQDLPEPFASRTLPIGRLGGWLVAPETREEAADVVRKIEGLFGDTAWPDGWLPEAGLLLGDFSAIRRLPEPIRNGTVPLYHYVPIEGIGLPPSWAELWRKIHPIAMSNFGADQLEVLMGVRPPMVYHGVDSEAFFPASRERPIVLPTKTGLAVLRNKAECKQFFGGDPSHTWLLRTDRHMPRKRYSSLLRAVAPVMARHPDVDFVYHCLTDDEGGNLADARSKFRPDIAARILTTGFHDMYGGIDRKILCALYNAADIYVSVSAEGFGLTIAEAMACGTPAIGLGYSAVPEVIGADIAGFETRSYVEGQGGVIVRPGGLIDNPYDHFWAAVDEPAFTEATEFLVTHKQRRHELGWLGSRHVAKSFTWTQAAQQFASIIGIREAVPA